MFCLVIAIDDPLRNVDFESALIGKYGSDLGISKISEKNAVTLSSSLHPSSI